MFRKVLVAAAATLVIGSAVLVSTDDASARPYGGGFRSALSGGGMRAGGTHVSPPVFRPSLTPKFAPKLAGAIKPGKIKPWPGAGKVKWPPHWPKHPKWPHWPKHPKYPCWKFPHHCHGPIFGGGAVITVAESAPVITGPAYAAAAPVAAAPAASATPVAAKSGPVCHECGGWTEDGGFMTYRKVVNEQTGQPELKCVKVFE